MPKLKKSSYEIKTEELEEAIFLAMHRKKLVQENLAKRLGKSQASVSRKLKDIDRISLGELREIVSFLGLEIQIKERGGR